MTEFEKMLSDDIGIVFLNVDEFGEVHNINGKRIPILYDEMELERVKNRSEFDEDVQSADILFFAKPSDLPEKIQSNSVMNIDNKKWFVKQAKMVSGLWRILLGRGQL